VEYGQVKLFDSCHVCLLIGLAYAEFVSRFTYTGSSYEFIKQGMGNRKALNMQISIVFAGVAFCTFYKLS
jgi:APA family basic amino acid/polyamine antiporter